MKNEKAFAIAISYTLVSCAKRRFERVTLEPTTELFHFRTHLTPFKTEETDLPVNIFIQGSNANGLGVNFTFLDTRYELTGELTAEDAFTFNAQKMTVDGFGDITVLSTSNGTFNGNALNATINIRLEDLPEFPLKLTFAGSK